MKKNLILTVWGRPEYAAAAEAALQVVGESDVIGVSMRQLAAVFEKESVGRGAVYVLGVGLGDDEESFASVDPSGSLARLVASRPQLRWWSVSEIDGHATGGK